MDHLEFVGINLLECTLKFEPKKIIHNTSCYNIIDQDKLRLVRITYCDKSINDFSQGAHKVNVAWIVNKEMRNH